MDEGRINGTVEIWDASEIPNAEDVEGIDWRCPGCSLQIIPAAWRRGPHKITAHFRRRSGQSHAAECCYAYPSRGGPNGRITGSMGIPLPWIDRISFPGLGTPRAAGSHPGRSHASVTHSSTRHSLTAACKFHSAIAGSRMDYALTVAGVNGNNYFEVFRPFPLHFQGVGDKIWFGDLFVATEPVVTDRTIEIAIAGHFGVVADTGDWSAFQRELLIDRIRAARLPSLDGAVVRPVVYVLGGRSEAQSRVVRFNDPRKFALIAPQGVSRAHHR